MRAILIDAKNKTVTETQVHGLPGLQNAVGGYIECAHDFDNGDTCYVNEEGLFQFEDFFMIDGAHQPFAGNGIIVGLDQESGETTDAKAEINDLKIKFATRSEVMEMQKTR